MKERVLWVQGLWDTLVGWLWFIGPLLMRVMLGYSMFVDGRGKLEHIENVGKFFSTLYLPFSNTPLPSPELQASLVAHLQYYCGALILAGFLTRFAAAALAGAMAGALLMSDTAELIKKWVEGTPTDATSTMLLVLAVALICVGAGPISVDGLLRFAKDWWLEKIDSARLLADLPQIIVCWVLRCWVGLAILALVPMKGEGAMRLVSWGIRSIWTRDPHPGEFEGVDNPPTSVTEFPPNILGLVLWVVGIAAIGALVWFMLRGKRAEQAATPG